MPWPDLANRCAHGLPTGGKAVDHRQAEAGPLPDRLGGEERIEGPRDHVGRHADAGIGDRRCRHIGPARRRACRARIASSRRGIARSRSSAVPPSGMASRALIARLSIALSSWCGSQKRRPQSARRDDLQLDRLADACGAAVPPCDATSWLTSTGFGSSGWRREKASSRWVSAAARLAEAMAARRVAVDSRQPALRDARLHQVERADDAGQQIVEIVRDAAGELADRFHLLRLPELFLQVLALGYVAHRRRTEPRRPGVIVQLIQR